MAGQFIDFINKFSDVLPGLPLMHSAEGHDLHEILQFGLQLSPKPCLCMQDRRLFTFYGRAAYRVGGHEEDIHNLSLKKPVCLILHPDVLVNADAMFPFDTGAFIKKKYKKWIPVGDDDESCKQNCQKFKLPPLADIPSRFVMAFFGSNDNYYRLNPLEKISANCPSVDAYFDMIKNKGLDDGDDRSSTLEVYFRDPIAIKKENVLGVVIPHDFIGKYYVMDLLNQEGIKWVTYESTKGTSGENTGAMRQVVSEVLVDLGFLQPRAGSKLT